MTTIALETGKPKSQSADIMQRARPNLHQHSHEVQPYGRIVKLPIALSEKVCATSVELLNQILADTMTLRDMYKKHHWQIVGPTFFNCICFTTSITRSRSRWSTASRSASSCWAG